MHIKNIFFKLNTVDGILHEATIEVTECAPMLIFRYLYKAVKLFVEYYYRFSQPRDHLQWRLVLGYYD